MIEERRRVRASGLLALVTLAALVVVAVGIFPWRQIIDQQSSVDLAEEKLGALQEENRLLAEEIAALSTDTEVERLAREQFGLVMPGEVGYVVVAPEGAEPPEARPLELDRSGDRPWWRDLWDFLTGRDLGGDG
ncbi:MAG TPA: septum formation initiator family protein [Acidimicrobiia bacterium]|nr:septum formation initiator family protein [Acidimicrobiia bacterium]